MGIYRLLDVLLENDPNSKGTRSIDDQKRIVIYYPPYNYHMVSSDMVCTLEKYLYLYTSLLLCSRSMSCNIRILIMTSFFPSVLLVSQMFR
jgi:hypothetical protein